MEEKQLRVCFSFDIKYLNMILKSQAQNILWKSLIKDYSVLMLYRINSYYKTYNL